MSSGLDRARQKMADAGATEAALDVFTHYYRELESSGGGFIREDDIEPLTDPPRLASVDVDPDAAQEALSRTVLIKLNGGLGTSMGLDGPKTLLPVRGRKTFLDVIVAQVLHARERYDARLPLLFMNSFRTRKATLEHLDAYDELPVGDLPIDFLQGFEPKLTVDGLEPVEWPADPALEWCPPGHGDIYTALVGTGILDQLLEDGFRYVSIANGDNLGAGPNATLAGWFAQSGAPYAAEVCPRTPNDRKGGHLAVRKSDGQLILRDTAQCAPEEMHFFTDEDRHPYFHANNLWIDLAALKRLMAERRNVLGLPLIRNHKTVDPSDPTSPEVVQMETAMGAAIEVFPGAQAIAVERDRFLPVKTTNELMLVRSDAFALGADARLLATTERLPGVSLDKRFYGLLPDFDARVEYVPSLREAHSLTVEGDWTFAEPVTVVGDAHLEDAGEPRTVEDEVIGQA
ncbi:MAG: UTP--glucose-1-phosphate uridylyltransferase [Propionibacteriaceae bacterium]|nr:UTP--glucose-1-phosphate uridylyltransferase [Propionibacteriaceae bacterium]